MSLSIIIQLGRPYPPLPSRPAWSGALTYFLHLGVNHLSSQHYTFFVLVFAMAAIIILVADRKSVV